MDEPDDLDELIRELNATAAGARVTASPVAPVPARPGEAVRLERWLRMVAAQHGADLLLVAGAPPMVRVSGRVQPLEPGPLDGVDIEEIVLPALAPHARRLYAEAHIADA